MLEKGVEEEASGQAKLAAEVDSQKLQLEGDSSTLRPFGRAFYNGEADYFVYPIFLINMFTIFVRVAVAALSSLPIIGAMHLGAGYFYGWPVASRNYNLYQVTTHEFYTVVLLIYIFMHFIHVNIWLMMEVFSKWLFIGRRSEGRFNYDTSNYGQNWEVGRFVWTRILYLIVQLKPCSKSYNSWTIHSATKFAAKFVSLAV